MWMHNFSLRKMGLDYNIRTLGLRGTIGHVAVQGVVDVFGNQVVGHVRNTSPVEVAWLS
jgi:hypothetical protein